MRFRRTASEAREIYRIELAPRSAYVIGGSARRVWQHSTTAVKAMRYAITFRTVREGKGAGTSRAAGAPRR